MTSPPPQVAVIGIFVVAVVVVVVILLWFLFVVVIIVAVAVVVTAVVIVAAFVDGAAVFIRAALLSLFITSPFLSDIGIKGCLCQRHTATMNDGTDAFLNDFLLRWR